MQDVALYKRANAQKPNPLVPTRPYRVAFLSHAWACQAGSGNVTRALAIRNSLAKQGVLLDQQDQWIGPGNGLPVNSQTSEFSKIEIALVGMPDALNLWTESVDDCRNILKPIEKQKYLDEHQAKMQSVSFSRRTKWHQELRSQIAESLYAYQCDLLLIDTQIVLALDTLSSIIDRPQNVWCLATYKEDLYKGVKPNSVDRLYQIERFYPRHWVSGIAIERARSLNEKAGIEFKPYQPGDYSNDWYRLNARQDRKLLPPVINVDLDKVLPKEEAKKALASLFNCDVNKPIGLLVGRTKSLSYFDSKKINDWQEEVFKKYNVEKSQIIKLGNKVGNEQAYLPDLYKYLPGVDIFLSSCGYNNFYTLRYLRQAGKFDGIAEFIALSEVGDKDQNWRLANQNALMDTSATCGTPIGNGADVIADLIIRKATNLGWKFSND